MQINLGEANDVLRFGRFSQRGDMQCAIAQFHPDSFGELQLQYQLVRRVYIPLKRKIIFTLVRIGKKVWLVAAQQASTATMTRSSSADGPSSARLS